MTPEEIIRTRVYDPYPNEPDADVYGVDEGWARRDARRDRDFNERRLAFALGMLAALAVGLGIGIAL